MYTCGNNQRLEDWKWYALPAIYQKSFISLKLLGESAISLTWSPWTVSYSTESTIMRNYQYVRTPWTGWPISRWPIPRTCSPNFTKPQRSTHMAILMAHGVNIGSTNNLVPCLNQYWLHNRWCYVKFNIAGNQSQNYVWRLRFTITPIPPRVS